MPDGDEQVCLYNPTLTQSLLRAEPPAPNSIRLGFSGEIHVSVTAQQSCARCVAEIGTDPHLECAQIRFILTISSVVHCHIAHLDASGDTHRDPVTLTTQG